MLYGDLDGTVLNFGSCRLGVHWYGLGSKIEAWLVQIWNGLSNDVRTEPSWHFLKNRWSFLKEGGKPEVESKGLEF